jgi:virginiamycin B lyase
MVPDGRDRRISPIPAASNITGAPQMAHLSLIVIDGQSLPFDFSFVAHPWLLGGTLLTEVLMGNIARFLTALAGMCGLMLCAVAAPAGAVAGPSRQAPASATAALAIAARPQQATERSWRAAQTSEQVTTWSQQAVVTEGPAATPVAEGGITVYRDSGGSDPIGIVAGPMGALWFTNAGPRTSIGRITAAGKITHYTDPRLVRPFAIAVGPDGALWFTNGGDPGSIGRITTSGALTFFRAPRISEPDWIAAGPGDALWFTNEAGGGYTSPSIERLTTKGTLTTFTAPSISAPAGIAEGPDGAMWFVNSEYGATGVGSIGRITTSGTVIEYTYPDSFNPKDITAGPDHSMWFINGSSVSSVYPSSIERITMGGVVTDFVKSGFGALGSDYLGGGGGMVEGPDGALWFIDYGSPSTTDISVVGRMTAGGELTTYVTPGRNVAANEIARGPGNTLWFTMGTAGIGRVSTLAFTSGPKLSGPSRVGKADTCLFGSLNATASTVAWLVNGAVLKGATGRHFTPTAADLGKALSCSVTLTNAGGSLTKKSATAKVARLFYFPAGAASRPAYQPRVGGPPLRPVGRLLDLVRTAPVAGSKSTAWIDHAGPDTPRPTGA